MKHLLLLAVFTLWSTPAFAATCSGGVNCNACKNCSACKHCSKRGGTCSVCRPDLYRSSATRAAPTTPPAPRIVPSAPHIVLPRRDSRPTISQSRGPGGLDDGRVITRRRTAPPASSSSRASTAPVVPSGNSYTTSPSARPIPSGHSAAGETEAMLQEQQRRDAALLRELGEVETTTQSQSTPTTSTTLQGKVVAVADGDTVTVLVNNKQVKVRLYGIDSPETGQPFGERAKQFTSVMAFGKTATVYSKGTDRYGRTLGWLFVGNTCVNRELVSNGLAWWYQEYAPDETKLKDLEVAAKEAKTGLWSEANAMAPWEWRRKQSDSRKASVPRNR